MSKRIEIRIVKIFTAVCLALLAGSLQAGELDSLVSQALLANPDLKSAQARYQAYQARIPQAGALPDPKFMFGYANAPWRSLSLDKMEMSGLEFGLSQEIPLFKTGLLKKSAKLEAESQKQSYQGHKNYLVSQVKQNYYDLYFWQKAREITRQNKSLLENLSEVAAAKYSVGKGIQQEVLKAQLEISSILHQVLMIEERRKSSRAALNILLNNPPQDSLAVAEELEFTELKLDESKLQKIALQNNPELGGMQAMVSSSQAEHTLAKREYFPNLELEATYMIRKDRANDALQGEDLLSFQASINLPIYFWAKQNKKVSETRWMYQSSQAQLEQVKNQVMLEVSQLYYQLENLEGQIKLHHAVLVPQARQALESARAAYQVNQIDFLALLESRAKLYQYEIEYYQLLSEYWKSVAQLEEKIGKPLP